jgi:hypothetical protein
MAAGDNLQMEKLFLTVDQSQSYQGIENLADGSYGEGSPALHAEPTKISAQTDSGEG